MEPAPDCPLCPRLVEYRRRNRALQSDWHNAPVPRFGGVDSALLIVGLAPGRSGANRTGRTFTGDGAGDLLFPTLLRYGFARGRYDRTNEDGLRLVDCAITNAVRCAPPKNRPTAAEIRSCRPYLRADLQSLPGLRAILALGRVAHEATLRALNRTPGRQPFAHGARHQLAELALYDSYHCSRYNINTGRLTVAAFHAVVARIRNELDAQTTPAGARDLRVSA